MSTLSRTLTSLTEQDFRHVQWQAELKSEDWTFVQTAITKLFQHRRCVDLVTDLPILNDKLSKLSKSNIAPFLGDFYQDQLLMKCMIILRHDVKEERGPILLKKLSQIWTQFYTSILPTLQAFFATVQLKCLSVRALTLLSFRDVVLLKTSISEALDISDSIPPEIYQMLLVLQSVRKTPPAEQFYQLQSLVSKVVHPYLCMQPIPSLVANVKRHHSLGKLLDKRISISQEDDTSMIKWSKENKKSSPDLRREHN